MTDLADNLADRLGEEVDRLRAVRDELRVRVHLGRAEVRDRWEKLEKDLQHVEAKLKLVREETRDDIESVADATRNLLKEIRSGYDHLKSLL